MKVNFVILIVLVTCLLSVSIACATDDLKINKDKDGTTWSVGSDESRETARAEEERDKDRAWDMLNRSSIILDKRPAK